MSLVPPEDGWEPVRTESERKRHLEVWDVASSAAELLFVVNTHTLMESLLVATK
ncbi:hypothetical protein PT974_11010 [Cladobotryum mycophilum]|uniref:Uncharacterized protein n=1 Tax=Cladobotryum mycophilum TaxID=491253 RepID=A0ABR0SBE8_9HYPO